LREARQEWAATFINSHYGTRSSTLGLLLPREATMALPIGVTLSLELSLRKVRFVTVDIRR